MALVGGHKEYNARDICKTIYRLNVVIIIQDESMNGHMYGEGNIIAKKTESTRDGH